MRRRKMMMIVLGLIFWSCPVLRFSSSEINSKAKTNTGADKSASGEIGDACKDNSDCKSGICMSGCFGSCEKGEEPGYCVKFCEKDSDCPPQSWCAIYNFYFGAPKGLCFKKCQRDFDCRKGYFCSLVEGEKFGVCLPQPLVATNVPWCTDEYDDILCLPQEGMYLGVPPDIFEGLRCGKVFKKLKEWSCPEDMECIHQWKSEYKTLNFSPGIGQCYKVCNPLKSSKSSECKKCFLGQAESLAGEKFCGICMNRDAEFSFLKKEADCTSSYEAGGKDYGVICPPNTACVKGKKGQAKCLTICDTKNPRCPKNKKCVQIKTACQGIGVCL